MIADLCSWSAYARAYFERQARSTLGRLSPISGGPKVHPGGPGAQPTGRFMASEISRALLAAFKITRLITYDY